MADELRLTITLPTTVSGALVPVLQTTGSYYLRVSPFSSNTYTGTHISTGSWSFGTIQDGVYELWNATGKIASFGTKYISDNEPNFANVYTTGKVYANEIAEYTSANGVLIDGVLIKDGDVLTDVITEKTTSAGVTIETVLLKDGKGTFTGLDTTINTSGSGATNRPKMVYSDGYSAPINDAEYAEKKYVDDRVATVTAIPYQESVQKVRVIVNGTVIANQVYNTIATAINSFGSPATTKRCLVSIEDTGNASKFISLAHSSLINYVNIKGISKHIELILGIASASTTAIVNFEDLTIYMGANDITTARTYNSVTFRNCDIYAYKSLTLTNCILENCRIFQPNGETVTVTGTTQLTNCILTNALTASGLTGIGYVANTTSEVNTSYTMPTDPSSSGA